MKPSIHLLKQIEKLKKYKDQQKNSIEVVRKIYKIKNENYLINIIIKLISYIKYCISYENKNLNNFKWELEFLEEGFKILGASEAAYLITEDFNSSIDSWYKYYLNEKRFKSGKPSIDVSISLNF